MQPKVVVITGGSGGLGRALAVELAKRSGFLLFLVARRPEMLEEAVGECGGVSVAKSFVADVTHREEVVAMLAECERVWGRVDILVNNAGRGCSVAPSKVTDADIDDMISVNVKSAVYGMQEVLPCFERNGGEGHIINVSSLLGRHPCPNPHAAIRGPYCGAKHFLNAMTECLRTELQGTMPKVLVSSYLPGVVATDFGLNAGGVDSRMIDGVQDVGETIDVLVDEVIVKRRRDVYSRPALKGFVASYYEALE